MITGSTGANVIKGGADVINGGSGDDRITYHGGQTSISGGSGNSTLVLGAAVNVNLGNGSDQTTGDSVAVTHFNNIDASASAKQVIARSGLTLSIRRLYPIIFAA